MDIAQIFFDADSLVYRNACAATPTHYHALYNGERIGKEFRYKADFNKWLKEQPEAKQGMYAADAEVKDLGFDLAAKSIDKAIFFARKKLGARNMKFFITDEGRSNFRFELARLLPYKAHRGEKPQYYQHAREYLVDHWNAEVVVGQEADDAVAQAQWFHYRKLMGNLYDDTDVTCIAHIDKDINMVPGYHYYFDTNKLVWISELDGLRFFYTQLITGDKQVDNIPGLYQICKKKALAKYKDPIQEMTTEAEMYRHVFNLYEMNKPDSISKLVDEVTGEVEVVPYPGTEAILTEIGNLLWMRREKGSPWVPPKL